MSRHVLVLFNQPTLDADHPDAESEREVVETAQSVALALEAAGYRVSRLGISHAPAPLVEWVRKGRPDVVFNLYEGVAGQGQSEAYAAGVLEWLKLPYTGCPFETLVLTRDKPLAKRLLVQAGLPTPRFRVVDRLPFSVDQLDWPVMVKLAGEHASVGLDQGSVVTNEPQLTERVELLLRRYGPPVLIEQYVEGREFNVTVVTNPELRVLPISEMVFSSQGADRWPIVTYEAKWLTGSAEDLATTPHCPADLESSLAGRLSELATEAFLLFGCRDYARIDFRVDPDGNPSILEVNPNPDLHPGAGLTRSLKAAGISHSQFVVGLVCQRF